MPFRAKNQSQLVAKVAPFDLQRASLSLCDFSCQNSRVKLCAKSVTFCRNCHFSTFRAKTQKVFAKVAPFDFQAIFHFSTFRAKRLVKKSNFLNSFSIPGEMAHFSISRSEILKILLFARSCTCRLFVLFSDFSTFRAKKYIYKVKLLAKSCTFGLFGQLSPFSTFPVTFSLFDFRAKTQKI